MGIKLENLSIHYDNLHVINNLNLSVQTGEFFSILGKSGCGKSTLLKSIAGLVTHSGHIFVKNTEVTNLPADQRNIAYVFQKPLLFPHLSVEENIGFGPSIHGWKKKEINKRVKSLLGLLQIDDLGSRMPNEISGGQQQRVAIARSLALNHTTLLMDEPFSSLDPYLKEDMYVLLKDIQKQLNLTILFVTHDVREAVRLSNRIGFLSAGNFVQIASPEEICSRPKTSEIESFVNNPTKMNPL